MPAPALAVSHARFFHATLTALLLAAPPVLLAQAPPADAPRGGIDLVVPFPPGGGAEFVAREIQSAFRRIGGPELRVVHRPGDGGTVGAEHVARSAADGTVLLLGSRASLVMGPVASGRRAFDPLTDFEPVALFATIPRLIVVHPSVPATGIDALIRLARSDPGALRCGTSDAMSEHAVQTFQRMTGVTLECVAYSGVLPAFRQDLLSGRIKLAFESAFLPEVQAGRLRALAVAGSSPLRALPGVPTASEAGMPGFDMSVWIGLFAPPGTPADATARVADALAKAMEDPDAQAAFVKRGYTVRMLTGRALRNVIEDEQRAMVRAVPARPAAPPGGN